MEAILGTIVWGVMMIVGFVWIAYKFRTILNSDED